MRTAIVGAGASGLSLALLLDDQVVVYERESRAGGHCSTTTRDGWTFDQGPHIMFSRDADVLSFMVESLGSNVHLGHRRNRVFLGGTLVKYPLENDLASLPVALRSACLVPYLFNEHQEWRDHPTNLDEWFVGNFGSGMTDLYFRPYNEKVWNVSLSELSMSWADRIPLPPAEDVVNGALGVETEGYLHQLNFHYPLVGGYEAITQAWTDRLSPDTLRLDQQVDRLMAVDGEVEVSTKFGVDRFDRVVWTAPIPGLLSVVSPVPDEVRRAIDSLRFNPIVIVTLGFRGSDPNEFTAVYFPDPDFLPNRVSAPSVFSPNNAPPGCFSLQAEITFAPGTDYLSGTDDDLIAHVLDGIRAAGLAHMNNEVVFADVQRIEYGYVVYTVGYEETVEVIRAWAEGLGIHLHGRFGAFEYVNVDGCVVKSRQLASDLNGRPTSLADIGASRHG